MQMAAACKRLRPSPTLVGAVVLLTCALRVLERGGDAIALPHPRPSLHDSLMVVEAPADTHDTHDSLVEAPGSDMRALVSDEPDRPADGASAARESSRARRLRPALCHALTWNVNMASDAVRLRSIGEVIRSQGASLVGLNEVSLSPVEFARQGRRWGYKHSLLLRTDRAHRFNVGLLATAPMVARVSSSEPPFFHGILCAALPSLGQLLVCATHLTPHSPGARAREAREIVRLLADESRDHPSLRVLLLGDLNSLAASDAPAHACAAAQSHPPRSPLGPGDPALLTPRG